MALKHSIFSMLITGALVSLGCASFARKDASQEMEKTADGEMAVIKLPPNVGGYHIYFSGGEGGGKEIGKKPWIQVVVTMLSSVESEITMSTERNSHDGTIRHLEKAEDKTSGLYSYLPYTLDVNNGASLFFYCKESMELKIEIHGLSGHVITYESEKL